MSITVARNLSPCKCGGTAVVKYGAALQSVFVQCEECKKRTDLHPFKNNDTLLCIMAAKKEWNSINSPK